MKNVLVKVMFTLTLFKILLFRGWLVLTPAKGNSGRKSVKDIAKLESFFINHFMNYLYEVMFSTNGL